MKRYLHVTVLLLLPLASIAQTDNKYEDRTTIGGTLHYPWLSLGINVGSQFNYAHVPDQVIIPSSGVTSLVAIPAASFGFRLQREYASHWSLRAGIDVSAFGFRLATSYGGGSGSRFNYLRGQTQINLSVQYYPLRYKSYKIRPYLRLGTLANIMTGRRTEVTIESRRRLNNQPSYIDLINFETTSWIKPGGMVAVGFARRIRSGFMFDFAFIAYRGLSALSNIAYRVMRSTESGPSEELLNTKITNRGSFIGFEGSIYLPPFRFKKIQRELQQR